MKTAAENKPAATTFRVVFTVERNGKATRKAIEGTNFDRLMARVEKLDGFNVQVQSLAVSS